MAIKEGATSMAETTTIQASPAPTPPPAGEQNVPTSIARNAGWMGEHKLYLLFAAIALAGSLFWVFTGDINPSTDDAQVDGNAIVISPRVSGYVEKMLIDDNTVVKRGDLMIQLDPANYQAKVDQARAALQVAEARATALKIAVPFTE